MKKLDITPLLDKISKEEFSIYFLCHSINNTAKHFNITKTEVEKLSDYYEVKKTPEDIRRTMENTFMEKYGVTNPSKSKVVTDKIVATRKSNDSYATSVEKAKQTKIKKYGSLENANEHMLKVQRETLIKKHGTLENAYASQQSTRVETFRKTFGVDNPFQSEDVKEKIRKTSISRYGTDYPNQNESVKQAIYNSKLEHFGPSNFGNWQLGHKTRIETYGSLEESYRVAYEKQKQTMLEKYGYECMFTNPEISTHKSKKNSGPNKVFANLLKRYRIEFQQEFVIGTKSFDFKVNNYLIEINPTITHNIKFNPYGQNTIGKTYHRDKSALAESNGYRCIHIWDWDDAEKIITQLILPKERLYARNCVVKGVTLSEAKSFIQENHLQGHAKDNIRLGLYYNDVLVSIMTFGKPRYNKNYEYELIRYCSSHTVVGGAEKLFKHFLKEYSPKSIISYCDRNKFEGNVYKKLGFSYKNTNLSTHWYHMSERIHILDSLLRARGFDQLLGDRFGKYGKGTSNKELMYTHGFVEIVDAGQSVYIYNVV